MSGHQSLRQDTAEREQLCASAPQRPARASSRPQSLVVCRESRAQSDSLGSLPLPSRQVFSAQCWVRVKAPRCGPEDTPLGCRSWQTKSLMGTGASGTEDGGGLLPSAWPPRGPSCHHLHGEKQVEFQARDPPLMVAEPGLGHDLHSHAGGRARPWRWGEDAGGVCLRAQRHPGAEVSGNLVNAWSLRTPPPPAQRSPKDPEWAGSPCLTSTSHQPP